MKYFFPLLTSLCCLMLLAGCSAGNKLQTRGFHEERYNLVIPEEWQKKAATIDAVTALLENTLLPLKGKDFCFNCNALYIVELEIVNFKTIAKTPVEQVFVFDARFVLKDTGNKKLSSLRIVDKYEEELVYYTAPSRPTHNPVVSGALYNSIRDVELAPASRLHQVSKNPDSGIREGKIGVGRRDDTKKTNVPHSMIEQKLVNKFILDKVFVLKGYLDGLADAK